PGGRFGDLDAGAPVVMRIGPPADEVLVATQPVLAAGAVGDQTAPPFEPVGVAGVVPVEPLAAGNGARERGKVMGTAGAVGIAAAMIAVAPVGQRHVIVDPDRVDGGRCPERIEMEADIAAAVLWLVSE